MKPRRPPEVCPVCNEDVPRNARACPDCGACYESGWSDSGPDYGSLGLPDWAYEDEEEKIVRTKFKRNTPRLGISPFWRIVAVVLIVATSWCLITQILSLFWK